jgi:hypothetical protein
MSSNNKRDMEASNDDDEYDEDYEDKGRLHDALLRKIGMLVWCTHGWVKILHR